MSLLDMLSDEKCWEKFYKYKCSLTCKKSFTNDLRSFIDSKKYLSVYENIKNGERFPLPEKSVISKTDSNKKRIVYSYSDDENTVLKLLTHLLLRKYDYLFSKALYSFRPAKTAKDAIKQITASESIKNMYSYKADISNYFNSIPIEKLLPKLKAIISGDDELYSFLSKLLTEKQVIEQGKTIVEDKGIMAGTPLSAFYANLYLNELDHHFEKEGIIYARYSDDIIVFDDSAEKVKKHSQYIKDHLHSLGLTINNDKECFCKPKDGWSFLGFSYLKGTIDISDVTVRKLKMKMRRKARALSRWKKRNDISGEKTAKAFIRIFNRKLFEGGKDNELTWALWFFPVINSDVRLKELDHYAQEQIRFLISGTRRKSRFNIRYDDIKKLGYKSLVHEYYDHCKHYET